MINILMTKLRLFYRNIWIFLLLTAGSVIFALLIGSGNIGAVNIPVYSSDDIMEEEAIIKALNHEADIFHFQLMDEERAVDALRSGKAEFILQLKNDGYRLNVNVQSQLVDIADQVLKRVYVTEQKHDFLAQELGIEKAELTDELNNYQVFQLDTRYQLDDEKDVIYSPLFGFSLFFIIYTVAYNVFYMLIERVDGIWDRMILSPTKKWKIYSGNLFYSFLIGYGQIVIVFSVFRFIFNYDFNERFILILIFSMPYIFTIVSITLLLISVVKSVQQFNVIVPLMAVSMAMLGGAFWPLDIVENKLMLLLAKLMPMTYGLEILNDLVEQTKTIYELLLPVSILVFMGVLFTGLAIHFMEKRYIN